MHGLCCWAIAHISVADPRDSVQFSRYADFAQHVDSPHRHSNATAILPIVYNSDSYHPNVRASLAELLAALAEPSVGRDKTCATFEQGIVVRGGESGTVLDGVESLEEDWKRNECEPPPYTDSASWLQMSGRRGESQLLCRKSGLVEQVGAAAEIGEKAADMHNAERGERDRKIAVLNGEMKGGQEMEWAEDVGAIVKQMKLEERKRRNRESAHRSNQCKRAVKAVLERELCRERQKVCELRFGEKRLREENRRLRASIAAQTPNTLAEDSSHDSRTQL